MTTETEATIGSEGAGLDAESDHTATEDATSIDGALAGAVGGDDSDSQLTRALEDLAGQVARFHERSERQEQIVRAMQERISALQGDQVLALLKPALLRFARLHAQAQESAVRAQERGEKAENDFAFFATSVEEALGLLDLDSIGAEEGAPFDSSRHAATEAIPTGDPALDRTIAHVVRQGFTYSDAKRVTLPAQVTVYRFDEVLAEAVEKHVREHPADEKTAEELSADTTSTDDTEEH